MSMTTVPECSLGEHSGTVAHQALRIVEGKSVTKLLRISALSPVSAVARIRDTGCLPPDTLSETISLSRFCLCSPCKAITTPCLRRLSGSTLAACLTWLSAYQEA